MLLFSKVWTLNLVSIRKSSSGQPSISSKLTQAKRLLISQTSQSMVWLHLSGLKISKKLMLQPSACALVVSLSTRWLLRAQSIPVVVSKAVDMVVRVTKMGSWIQPIGKLSSVERRSEKIRKSFLSIYRMQSLIRVTGFWGFGVLGFWVRYKNSIRN